MVCQNRNYMSKSHNKKRNVGLLYEFLVSVISRSLVDGDKKKSAQALKILRKHFKQGTELYKEFRLINSLIKTTVSSESVAANILSEARVAARSHDVEKLDRQKSFLIKDVNHLINDENFYDQQVNRYRTLATIQSLINDWRSNDRDIARVAQYEDSIMTWLMTEKEIPGSPILTEESPGTSRLLMKVMMKKLNEKYSGVLNDEQKSLIRAYAFSAANNDESSIKLKLFEVKQKLLTSIDEFGQSNKENEYINKKLVEARSKLLNEKFENVDDDTVTRFMLYTKLASELGQEEG